MQLFNALKSEIRYSTDLKLKVSQLVDIFNSYKDFAIVWSFSVERDFSLII